MNVVFFNDVCFSISRFITQSYTTSFSLGIRVFHKKYRKAIYAVYALVRFGDEIVDTFHGLDKTALLKQYKQELDFALQQKISTNPVLNSFQLIANKYGITNELIEPYFYSMQLDISKKKYDQTLYERYIYGSAEVIGLMCLRIFCEGNEEEYKKLRYPAQKLGAALQKVNFLRDIRSDYYERGRIYFPDMDIQHFDHETKQKIEADIQQDFDEALPGILKLNPKVRLGVFVAYKYYLKLLQKIKKTPPNELLKKRVRIPNFIKFWVMVWCYICRCFGKI